MRTNTTVIELPMNRLEDIARRAEAKRFDNEDYASIKAITESYIHLTILLKDKNASIGRLRKALFGASTEKTAAVVGSDVDSDAPRSSTENAPGSSSGETDSAAEPESQPKGHGRNGAAAYEGAEKIRVSHESLEPGDPCPDCAKGTVYAVAQPTVLVRITGQAPVAAKVYELDKLRCQLCGKVFTATPPPDVGSKKYDAAAGSMIGLLKYGSGLPFNRLDGLQGNLGIPLPASTQWDIVNAKAKQIEPAHRELIRQAAEGDVVYNDDTTVKILELMGTRARQNALAEGSVEDDAKKKKTRSGLFTSGVVSTREGRRIALFFSGRQHAGENLKNVLARRAETLSPPIQMCDALSRNLPGELKTIVAHCLAHGRRQFVEVAEHFPEPCRRVLESLAVVYRNDATARERELSPQARLDFHQAESGSTMEELRAWLTRQFEERLVEPNSSLGGAIN